jgi:DNA-binding protein YbaB
MIFGNLGKMGEMLKQAQQLKSEIGKARYEAESGGVRVVINGEMEITELTVPPGAAAGAIREAVNRGLKAANSDMAQKMSKITGGLQLPGM